MEILLLEKILLSIALGAFIGLERERHKGHVGIGIRTSAFICLLGMLATYFSLLYGMFIILSAFVVVSIFSIFLFWYRVKEQRHHVGLTTSTVMMIIFFIGVMTAIDLTKESIIISIILFAMLFFKSKIKHKIKHISDDEIIDALEFAILAFVIYPFIPDGEYFYVNLKMIWEVVIVVSLISFLGFLAIRKFGSKRGVLLSSLLGGVIASGATAITLINEYKKNRKLVKLFVVAIMISMTVMLLRNFLIAFLISHDISTVMLFLKYITVTLLFLGFVLYFLIRDIPNDRKSEIRVESPFAIKPALYFGLVSAIILIIGNVAMNYLGTNALLPIAIIGGFVNSASTAAMSAVLFLNGSIAVATFTQMIVLACIGSMLNDIAFALFFKEKKLAASLTKYVLALSAFLILLTLI